MFSTGRECLTCCSFRCRLPCRTNAFIEGGLIDDTNRCTSVACKPLSLQGLLSELIQLDVKYASEPDGALPSTFVVKFSPPSKKTLLLINLFKFGQTEFLNYKKLAPYFPCRVPRLWAGDMNFTSGRQCMVMDKIDAEFIAVEQFDRYSIKHVEKILDVLAQIHATFWGDKLRKPGLSWLISPDHESIQPVYKIFAKEVKKAWDAWVLRVADPWKGGKDPGTGFAQMEVPQEVLELKDYFVDQSMMQAWLDVMAGPTSEWLTFTHGDPRLDNFFFDDETWASDEGLPGVIDLQISQCSNAAIDAVYPLIMMNVYHRWPEEVDRLLQRYFEKLQALGGAPGKDYAEFEEQLALGAAYRCMGSVIGVGGIDLDSALNPQQTLEVLHLLNTGSLLAMQRHGSAEVLKNVGNRPNQVANALAKGSNTFEHD
eukprot:SAG31_NODE_1199_length_9431_cov_18.273789_6_plen_427_part_00